MRSVLFISLMNGVSWGGSEELWFQTALYAARQGYKVGCAFYDWPQKKERIEQLRNAGCELYLFSNKGREKRNLWQRITYKFTRLNVKKLARSLPVAQYDITVINLGYLEIVSHHWKRFYTYLNRYALLFHVHNENENIKESRKELAKRWIAGASHTLFASVRTKEFFERQLNISLPNAKILINPISFEVPLHCQPYPPPRNGNFLFVMLATLDVKRKAQDNLIKALSTDQWKERPWQLFLYGTGDAEKQLQELIQQGGLGEKIFLKGHTTNVKNVLDMAHLLLQITHIDAMPLAVMEAMAMAKPIVVSNVGDMPAWVYENENGWVSEDASVSAIEQTLEKAWQNRNRWEEMGRRSFALFKEKFPDRPEAYLLKQLSN